MVLILLLAKLLVQVFFYSLKGLNRPPGFGEASNLWGEGEGGRGEGEGGRGGGGKGEGGRGERGGGGGGGGGL